MHTEQGLFIRSEQALCKCKKTSPGGTLLAPVLHCLQTKGKC